MKTVKYPYEFLARWDRNGGLAGAHVQFRYVTETDAGDILGECVGAAETVALGTASGFPLTEILSPLVMAALLERDSALAERDALAAQLAQRAIAS